MIEHSTSLSSASCDICHKTFASLINLKSHKKYVHSDFRKWSCVDCDAKFKQKRDLRAHMLKIHNLNQMKEDYFEEKVKQLFKCKDCSSTFQYQKSLNAHVKANHSEDAEFFQCEDCT